MNRRMFVINRAIAIKFGNLAYLKSPLETEDWSDCDLPFKLAVSVLEDRFDDSCDLMKQIGAEHKLVTRTAYDTWPVFKEFRENEKFRSSYKSLFGDEFEISNIPEDETEIVKDESDRTDGRPEIDGDSTNGIAT